MQKLLFFWFCTAQFLFAYFMRMLEKFMCWRGKYIPMDACNLFLNRSTKTVERKLQNVINHKISSFQKHGIQFSPIQSFCIGKNFLMKAPISIVHQMFIHLKINFPKQTLSLGTTQTSIYQTIDVLFTACNKNSNERKI